MVLTRSAGNRSVIALAAVVAGVALLGLLLPNEPVPSLALLNPFSFFGAVLADFGAAAVLLASWRSASSRRSTMVLALAFTTSATMIFLAMLVLPLMPAEPAMVAARPQAGIWLFVFWHLAIAVGALIYLAVRRTEDASPASRRFTLAAVALTVLATAAAAFVAILWSDRLPALAAGASLAPFASSGVGPVTALVTGLAALLVFRTRRPSTIDRGLAISLLALTLDTALLCRGGHRYTALFYAGKALLLGGTLVVLISAVQTLVAARVRLSRVEWMLSKVELESERRAGRIRAVWKIASHIAPDRDRFSAILAIATEALRPGLPTLGLLSHLEGETLVVDTTAWSGPEKTIPGGHYLYPGSEIPFERSLQSLLSAEGSTLAWDDLAFLDGRGMPSEGAGWRSYIGTPVTIARRTYFVAFALREPTLGRPFAEDDIAYVDVVASFFANRVNEQQQFDRIQFQVEHDALTGLENRVQFRKAIREEIHRSEPFAVAIVDLDGFRHVNEHEGHQIGDEVLVKLPRGSQQLLRAIWSRASVPTSSASCCAERGRRRCPTRSSAMPTCSKRRFRRATAPAPTRCASAPRSVRCVFPSTAGRSKS